MVLLFCIVSSGTVTNFFPAVVSTLGYDRVPSLLLTAPPYVLAVIVTYLNATHADKTGERYWHVVGPMIVAIIAYIIAATTSHIAPRYLSMMLMVCLPPTPFFFLVFRLPPTHKLISPPTGPISLLRLRSSPSLDLQHHAPSAGETRRRAGVYQCRE